ncbi:MAG TPA: hypothetical protein PKL77_11335 [Candidatus Omnitrophota bacterium]|nr:hypothetical protein [Candidatus Omnitrophota bacterium]
MCPYFISSKTQSLCACYPGILFCPSLQRRHDFCFSRFRDCTYFKIETLSSMEPAQKEDCLSVSD